MTVLTPVSRRQSRHALGIALLSLWSGLAFAALPDQPAPSADPNTVGKRLTVAVLYFQDLTGDPNAAHWRYVAGGLLGNQLRNVRQTRLLSAQAVRYGSQRAGLCAGDRVDPNIAGRVGETIEAQRVIWGSYSRARAQWHVKTSVLNVATGHVSRLDEVTARDWLELTDQLSESVLAELGIVPSEEERAGMAKRWVHSVAALESYGRAYMSQEQAEPVSQQQRLLRQALAADPNCTRALVGLAATLASEGKYGDAEDAVRRALQIDDSLAEAYHVLGRLVMMQRQPTEAERLLRRAWRLKPDDATYPMVLAQLSMAQGKRAQGVTLLEAAAALDRTDADIHASLALAYAVLGRGDQALDEIKALLNDLWVFGGIQTSAFL